MLRFLLIIGLGLVVCNPVTAQKKSEKGPPKRLLPDAGYQKFLSKGVIKVKSNAITFQLLDPIVFGSLGVGYQRKLHRRVMAEANLGIGIGKSMISDYTSGMDYDLNQGSDQFFRPESKATRPVFSLQTQLIHNNAGQLVNYCWGYGLYYKYSKYANEWDTESYNKKSPIITNDLGLVFTTQTALSGSIGLGFTFGAAMQFVNVKDVPYLPEFGNTNKNVQLRSEKFMTGTRLIQVKLNYLF